MTHDAVRVGLGLIWTFYLAAFAWELCRGRQLQLSEMFAALCAVLNIVAIGIFMWAGLLHD